MTESKKPWYSNIPPEDGRTYLEVGDPQRYQGHWGEFRRTLDEVFFPEQLQPVKTQVTQGRKRLKKVVRVKASATKLPEAPLAVAASLAESVDEGMSELRSRHDSFVTRFFGEETSRRREQITQVQADLGHFRKILNGVKEWFLKALQEFPEGSTDPDVIATLKILYSEAMGEAGRAMDCLDDYLSNLADLQTAPRKHYGYYLNELESAMANIARNSEDLSLSVKGFLEYTANLKKD